MTNQIIYPDRVSDNDEYKTPEKVLGRRLFPSLYFFPRMLWILIHSNRLAKRFLYNRLNWYISSVNTRKALESSGLRMHFTGMDNLRKVDGPVILVSNHMSTLETVVLPSIIQSARNVVYVIKEELARYPLFGPIGIARHPILVGRENPREDLKIVMDEGTKRIQDGRSVIIFPQKTRSVIFDVANFNSLGNKLAKRNNIPVIPVALLTDAWGNGKLIKEAGKIDPSKTVHVAFGEPITIKGTGSEEHQLIINFISSKLREWGRPELVK